MQPVGEIRNLGDGLPAYATSTPAKDKVGREETGRRQEQHEDGRCRKHGQRRGDEGQRRRDRSKREFQADKRATIQARRKVRCVDLCLEVVGQDGRDSAHVDEKTPKRRGAGAARAP